MKSKEKSMFYKTYNSPVGKIYLTSDGENLTALFFETSKDLMKYISNKKQKDLQIFNETENWLNIYFSGKNPNFTPNIKIENLTPFREKVIEKIKQIPYGKTISYGQIAREIAKEKGIKKMSAQAVGGAVGWNPICLIIPCHRVVGENGKLVGYGGGLEIKTYLLNLEKSI